MRPGTRQLLGEHARQGAALNWPILLRDTDRFYAAIDTRLVPTVEVRPGTPFQVFFFQEVQLPPYREQTRYRFFNDAQAKRP